MKLLLAVLLGAVLGGSLRAATPDTSPEFHGEVSLKPGESLSCRWPGSSRSVKASVNTRVTLYFRARQWPK